MGRRPLGTALPVAHRGPVKRITEGETAPLSCLTDCPAFRVGPKTARNHPHKAASRLLTHENHRSIKNAVEAAQKKERKAGKLGQFQLNHGVELHERLYFNDQRGNRAIGKVVAVSAAWIVLERKYSRSYNRSSLVAVRHDAIQQPPDAEEED